MNTHTPDDYLTIPPDTYRCRIDELRRGTTLHGHERWAIRLVVAEGRFAGCHAAWDAIVLSERGRMRAARIFAAFGLAPEASDQHFDALSDRQAMVTIVATEFVDGDTRAIIWRNEVPYDGYRALST